MSTNDLLSEADFQRVVQDITPADRDLFDEFLNGIKQKTDDYLFLSSFDDLPSNSIQEHDSISRRHASFSSSTPPASSTMSSDRRRNSIPRGSSTIHYNPHSIPISNRPPLPPPPPPPQPASSTTNTAAAAQTLKQMAVQHQQRAMYHQQQTTSYSSVPYNQTNLTRPYYQSSESESVSEEVLFSFENIRTITIHLDIQLSFDMLSTCSTNECLTIQSSHSTTFEYLWHSKLFLSNFIYFLSTTTASSTTTTIINVFLSHAQLSTVKRSSNNFIDDFFLFSR